MMERFWKRTIVLWVILIASCTVQLVPDYDSSLVQGLDGANTSALTLFATVEKGSTQAEFAEIAPRYAEIIGKFDALRQRAESRPIPPLSMRLSKLSIVRDFCQSKSDPTGCVNASPAGLARVLAVLRKMRDKHQSAGLRSDGVELFRTDYDIAIGQVLTVENALKR